MRKRKKTEEGRKLRLIYLVSKSLRYKYLMVQMRKLRLRETNLSKVMIIGIQTMIPKTKCVLL